MTWIVEMIDPGCDCCSYIAIGQFDTEAEALACAGEDENLRVYSDDEEETE